MIVFIQHRKTGLYWSKAKTWTSQREEALDFKRTITAVDFCKKKNWKDVELVLTFSGSDTAVRVAALVRVAKDERLVSLIGASMALQNGLEWVQSVRWLGTTGGWKMSSLGWLGQMITGLCGS